MDVVTRARLVAMTGPLAGSTFPLAGAAVTIGRSADCDIALGDATVSRRHCVVRLEGPGFVLEDLESRHGTRVGGQTVALRALRHGDRIHVGHCTFAFEMLDELPARVVEAQLGDTDESMPSLELTLDDHAPLTDAFDASRPARALEVLARVSASLGALTDTAALEQAVLEGLLDTMPAERAGLIRLEPGDSLAISRVLSRAPSGDDAAPFSRTVARHAVRTRSAVVERDVSAHAELGEADSVMALGPRSVACIPLISRDRIVGLAYVDGPDTSTRLDEHDLRVAAAITGMAAMPLESAWRGAAEAEAQAAPAPTAAHAHEPRPVIACLGSERLHLGDALAMATTLERLRGLPPPRVLLLDPGGTEVLLQRMALLPAEALGSVAAPAKIATIGRLALSWVATLDVDASHAEPRAWLTRLVAATALVVSRASWCAWLAPPLAGADTARADPGLDAILLARKLAARIQKVAPGLVAPVLPLMPSMPPLPALDGSGLMGASARGTIWVNDPDDVIARKIRSAKTDTRASLDPEAGLSREVAALVLMHAWTSGDSVESLLHRYGGQGYGALKQGAADAVIAYLGPVRARIEELRASDLGGRLAEAAAGLETAGAELERALAHERP